MARRTETRHCRKCGDAYQATPGSSVVNCPRHRGRPVATSAQSDYDRRKQAFVLGRFNCTTCGEHGNRGWAFKHRRAHPGHKITTPPKP